jgi:hypothetical protein
MPAVPLLDVAARVRRIEALLAGLHRESALVRQIRDPLLFHEREAYLAQLEWCIKGFEGARVALQTALERLERLAGG